MRPRSLLVALASCFAVVALCGVGVVRAALPPSLPGHPIADPRAVVQPTNQTRFTVLHDAVVRMEYVPAGADSGFVDSPTQTFWNRRTRHVPHFTTHVVGSVFTLDTP